MSVSGKVFLLFSLTILDATAASQRITTGPPKSEGDLGAGEGPAWDPAGYLYFSGGNRISRRDGNGKAEVFRDQAGTNGLLIDPQKRLVACESRSRRITRAERDGSITVLA